MLYLETDRLILRDYSENDFEIYAQLKMDKDTMYYLHDLWLPSLKEAREDFENVLADMKDSDRKFYFFHMELKDTHEQVGCIGYDITSETPLGNMVHLGYFSYPKFWGNGYMTESVKRILEFAFEENNVYRVSTGCLSENKGSEKVMLNNGFIREAEKPDFEWHDGKMKTRLEYRLFRREWEELKKKL